MIWVRGVLPLSLSYITPFLSLLTAVCLSCLLYTNRQLSYLPSFSLLSSVTLNMSMPDPSQIPPYVPLSHPPPGQESNFANPDTTHLTMIKVAIAVCLSLSTSCVVARVYVRTISRGSFGWDDGKLIPSPLYLIIRLC